MRSASPSRVPPGRPLCGPGDQRTRRLPAGPQRAVQKVFHALHAAGRQLCDLHQVHAVLASTARMRLSTTPGRNLRRHLGSLLRLRHLRSQCGRQGLHQDGQTRSEFHDNNSPVGGVQERQGRLFKIAGSHHPEGANREKRTHGFRFIAVSIKNRSPRLEIANKASGPAASREVKEIKDGDSYTVC